MLSIAIDKRWHFHQMDIQKAFIHGVLNEEIFMRVPQGHPHIPSTITNLICQLNKFIYGLNQGSYIWFQKILATLTLLWFDQCRFDYSLFNHMTSYTTMIILAYVDNLLLEGNDLEIIISIEEKLKSFISITILGELYYFLGLEFSRKTNGMYVGQHKYALELLQSASLIDSKPVITPCVNDSHSVKHVCVDNWPSPCLQQGSTNVTLIDEPQQYRSICNT